MLKSSRGVVRAKTPTVITSAGVVRKDSAPQLNVYKVENGMLLYSNVQDKYGYARHESYPDNTNKYFVKCGSTYDIRGKLLDPWGANFREGDDKKYIHDSGQFLYEYKQVSKICFDHYVSYLKNRDKVSLSLATGNL
jgi:hypothetical protein